MMIWTKKKKIIGERQNEKTFNRLRTLWNWIFLVISVFKEFFMNEIEILIKKSDECMEIARKQKDVRLLAFWGKASLGYLIKAKKITAQFVQGEN